MTKKIMFLLTASILSLGIMTGCSGNSGNTQSDDGNNAVSQADTQSVSDNSADDATGSSINTVVGSGITDDNGDSAGTTAASTQASNSNDGYITEEEASSIALAEVDGATADELRIYKDTDDNRNIYEGSIYHDNIEYDFEIDAQTGDIIDWSSEKDDDNWNNTQNNGNGDIISEKKAKNIALGQVEGATESDLRIHRDNDDGREIYEGSIFYNEMEYEFEIDAQTGDIIDWSSESIYD